MADKYQPDPLNYKYHIIAMERHYTCGMIWGNNRMEDLCADFYNWMKENDFENRNLRYADVFESDNLKHLYHIEIYEENKILLNPVKEADSVNPMLRVFMLKIKFKIYDFIARILSVIFRIKE